MQTRRVEADRSDLRVAHLAALAIVVHVAEAALPSPVPGIKPGLANVVTVTTQQLYGWRVAAWVAGIRCLAGSLLLGSFLAPTFFLSLGGATASVAALGFARLLPGIGTVGLSVCAGVAHVSAQLFVAWALFVPHAGLLYLLPILLTAATITGAVNGIIARMMLDRIDRMQPAATGAKEGRG